MTNEVTALELLREAALELNHSKVFIRTREKMHPDGVKLYDELLDQIYQFLKASPVEPSENVVRLPVADSRMVPVSDALERLLSVMRRQGMATLLASCEGFTVRVEPENRTPDP